MSALLQSALSRRDFLKLAGQGLATAMLLAGCDTSPGDTMTETPLEATTSGNTPTPGPTPDVNLDVMIGQMLMIGFRGLEVDDEHFIVRDIRERHLGGVVLFDYDVPTQSPVRNVQSPAQVKALVASLQCSVEKTRCPVMAAWIAIVAVSESRISPTKITSGSWRKMALS